MDTGLNECQQQPNHSSCSSAHPPQGHHQHLDQGHHQHRLTASQASTLQAEDSVMPPPSMLPLGRDSWLWEGVRAEGDPWRLQRTPSHSRPACHTRAG